MFDGQPRQLDPRADAELADDLAKVELDGAAGEVHALAELCIGVVSTSLTTSRVASSLTLIRMSRCERWRRTPRSRDLGPCALGETYGQLSVVRRRRAQAGSVADPVLPGSMRRLGAPDGEVGAAEEEAMDPEAGYLSGKMAPRGVEPLEGGHVAARH
jgi:hypothetical protein